MTDLELLKEYSQTRSEAAFGELVRRHLDWVYSAAVRQVRDRELAEDVAQGVFVALAGQAGSLGRDQSLSPWLLRVTRCAAISALRAVSRRQRHEQKAAEMRPESTEAMTEGQWEELAPMLDEGVLRLGKMDREAVLLRFYERKSFAEVGEAMGVSEKAAAKRVERAVEKLRGVLAKKGVMAGVGALGVVMAERVIEAAPAGLAKAATAAAGGGGAVSAGVIAKGAIKMMVLAKVKVAAVVLLVVVLGGTGAWHVLAQTPAPLRATTQAIVAGLPAADQRLPVPDREVFAARLRALGNVRVECDTAADYGPPHPRGRGPTTASVRTDLPTGFFVPYTGVRHTVETFSRLGNRRRWEVSYGKDVIEWDRSRGSRPLLQSVRTVSDDRQEVYSVQEGANGPGSTEQDGSIQNRPPRLEQACLMEYGLGLRADDLGGWINEQRLNQMTYESIDDDKIVLRETEAVGRIHEWEFSRALGLAMVAYRAHMPDAKWVVEVIPSDFRSVNGVMLPFTIVRRHLDKRDGPTKEVFRAEARVKQCGVNDPANTPEQYLIKWPEGTRVNDIRIHVAFVIGRGGKVLTDEEIGRATSGHPGEHAIDVGGE